MNPMSQTVLGIDQATKTGYAVVTDGEVTTSGTKVFSTQLGKRLVDFESWFREMLITHTPSVVVYEKPHFRGYDSTISCVGLIINMIKVCYESGTPLVGVHSATLKSFATGYGKATKEQMTKAATEHTGIKLETTKNNDEADAIHLAQYGWFNVLKEKNAVQ